jgi:hypothetical protein
MTTIRDGFENSAAKLELPTSERVAVLVVAYYNLAVEMEFLKKNLESKKIYAAAYQLAS